MCQTYIAAFINIALGSLNKWVCPQTLCKPPESDNNADPAWFLEEFTNAPCYVRIHVLDLGNVAWMCQIFDLEVFFFNIFQIHVVTSVLPKNQTNI